MKTLNRTPWMASCVAAVLALGAYAETQAGGERASPVGIVLALDTSGSLRHDFPRVVDWAEGLVDAVPDGGRLALIRFDEDAQTVASTHYLTSAQRPMIFERVRELACDGQWTNYSQAVEEIQAAVDLLGAPLLLVVATDGVSDPSRGEVFADIGRVLQEAFGGRGDVSTLVLLPEVAWTPVAGGGVGVRVAALDAMAPGEVLALVPRVEDVPPVEQETCAAESEEPTPLEIVVGPVDEPPALLESPCTSLDLEAAIPVDDGPASAPAPVTTTGERPVRWGSIGGVAAASILAAIAATVVCLDRQRAKRLRPKPQPGPKRAYYEVIARSNGITYRLGAKDAVEVIRIGTEPGCDIPLPPAGGKSQEIRVRQRQGRFYVHNRRGPGIKLNNAVLAPGKTRPLRFPARLVLDKKQAITLSLHPTQPPKPPQAKEKSHDRNAA